MLSIGAYSSLDDIKKARIGEASSISQARRLMLGDQAVVAAISFLSEFSRFHGVILTKAAARPAFADYKSLQADWPRHGWKSGDFLKVDDGNRRRLIIWGYFPVFTPQSPAGCVVVAHA